MLSSKLSNAIYWTSAGILVCLVVAAICVSRVNIDLVLGATLGSAALVAALVAFVSPYFRLLVYVGGALLVMQSDSQGLGALKPAYLAFIIFAALAGALNTFRLPRTVLRAYRPIFGGSLLMVALIVVEAVLSISTGVDPARVLRDATTYIMVAAAPFIASAAAEKGGTKRARRTAAIFTLAGAIGFAVYWLSARGIATLGIERLGMFSFVLAGCGFAIGLAYGLVRRNWLWISLGLLCFLSVLVTGTRTGLVMLAGLLGLVGSKRAHRVPPWRMVVGLGIVGLTLVFALPMIASALAPGDFLARRTAALGSVLSDGVSSDQSGAIRERALAITLGLWSDNPIFGVGFGYLFPSPTPALPPSDFQLDSPALALAKFGAIGTCALIAVFVLFIQGISKFHTSSGVASEAQAAGLSLVFICLGLAVLGLPMEDKGFALSFALIFYLLGSEALADGIVNKREPALEPASVS